MKLRRASTSSPIRMENSSSAAAASSRVIWRSTRTDGSMVVSHSSLASISPRPLYRWMPSSTLIRLPACLPAAIRPSRSRSEYANSGSERCHLSLYSGGWARKMCPFSTKGFMNRNNRVSSSVEMCWPSTSASAISTILWYRSLARSNSSWMPVPSAVMIAWTSVFFSTRSMRAFSTLMILPRSGRIAWNIESRPLLAEPPAESPSTTYSSDLRGSVDRQSASLPGSPPMSVALLRRTSSRALRAARRACADETALLTTVLASAGFASNQWLSCSLPIFCTNDFTSVLPSLVLVWPSNCGSDTFTERTAARPSRMSSPVRLGSLSLSSFLSLAYLFTTLVNAARNPSSWVPPSWVLMVLAKVCTDSEYPAFHCIATSTSWPSPLP